MGGGVVAQISASTGRKVRKCTHHCNTLPVSIVWWRNGKAVKNLNPSQKRTELLWTTKWKQTRIEWSGARLQANTVA